MKKSKIALLCATALFLWSAYSIFSNSTLNSAESRDYTLVYTNAAFNIYNKTVDTLSRLKNSVFDFVEDFVEKEPENIKPAPPVSDTQSGSVPAVSVVPDTDVPTAEVSKEETVQKNDLYNGMPPGLYKLIRKGGHFAEFALMAFFLSFATFTACERVMYLRAFAVGLCCGVFDEFLQHFTPGRDMRFDDVIIDFCGVILGVTAGYIIIKFLIKATLPTNIIPKLSNNVNKNIYFS